MFENYVDKWIIQTTAKKVHNKMAYPQWEQFCKVILIEKNRVRKSYSLKIVLEHWILVILLCVTTEINVFHLTCTVHYIKEAISLYLNSC